MPVKERDMITGDRMAAIDENAAFLGVSRLQLMESSGNAIAQYIREIASPGATLAFVCGLGNNGGDAFVAARFLEDFDCTIYLLGRPEDIKTEIAHTNWKALEGTNHSLQIVRDSQELDVVEADIVIDAILGTGISGELREPVAIAAEVINTHDGTVVSVDVPTGLDANTGKLANGAVNSEYVITFHDTKPGVDDLDGTVTIADIGIPKEAERIVGPGDLRQFQPNERSGRAYVIGGGPYAGAPALAASAALRTGMELAFIASPDAIASEIQSYDENLIVQPFDGEILEPRHVDTLVETATRYDDTVIIGPGLGTAPETLEAITQFLSAFSGRAVVDADALAVVPEIETDATLVCTPNRKELTALGGPETDDITAVIPEIETLARNLGHVILAKGPVDVITDGDQTRLNRRGHPGMGVGGTGDILAGIVAGLCGQIDPFNSAAVGAYVNGVAGERAGEISHLGLLATELLPGIPQAIWPEATDTSSGER